jgi:hypothetical protein
MADLMLKQKVLIKKYTGKSISEFWNELHPGDILELRYAPSVLYGKSRPSIIVTNLRTGKSVSEGSGTISNRFEKIEFEDYE